MGWEELVPIVLTVTVLIIPVILVLIAKMRGY